MNNQASQNQGDRNGESCNQRQQYLSSMNSWVQPFFSEFRNINEFSNIVIGAHAEKKVVYICGKIESQEKYTKLLNYLDSKKPPFELLPQITFSQ